MNDIISERTVLRSFKISDADFILEITNDPDFIKFIGDRNIRDLDQARSYLRQGPLSHYRQYGFGLLGLHLKKNNALIGMCGLIKRDYLESPDLGFAMLPAFRNNGYACEASKSVLDWAKKHSGLTLIYAIVNPKNHNSTKLLKRLGFRYERQIMSSPNDRVSLYSVHISA